MSPTLPACIFLSWHIFWQFSEGADCDNIVLWVTVADILPPHTQIRAIIVASGKDLKIKMFVHEAITRDCSWSHRTQTPFCKMAICQKDASTYTIVCDPMSK